MEARRKEILRKNTVVSRNITHTRIGRFADVFTG